MKITDQKVSRALAGACLLTIVLAVSAQSADVPGIITKTGTGQQLRGTIRYQGASKMYLITGGTPPITLKVAPREVASIQVKKPAQIDKAVQAARRGKCSAAIPVLQQIAQDYSMLQWDIPAAQWLAHCYLAQKDARNASSVTTKVVNLNPDAVLNSGFAKVYWEALVETEQFSKLRKALERASSLGDRELAAVAQNKWGDLETKKGNHKDALLNGYLRTIVFFEQVKTAQPEALYKAAKAFEELGQHSHAEKMRKRLLAEYPHDEYSAKLRSEA